MIHIKWFFILLILTIILCFLTSYWGFSVKWLHFIFPQKDEVKFAGSHLTRSHQNSRRSRREGLGRSEIDIETFLANNSDRQHSPRLECMNCRLRQKDKTLISILFLDFCKKVKRRRRRGWWRRRSSSSRGWPYSPSQDQIWSALFSVHHFHNHRELFQIFFVLESSSRDQKIKARHCDFLFINLAFPRSSSVIFTDLFLDICFKAFNEKLFLETCFKVP